MISLDVSQYLPFEHGFCFPDWEAISDLIEREVEISEWNRAWTESAKAWLQAMVGELGGDYAVYESQNFLILGELSETQARTSAQNYEKLLVKMSSYLGSLVEDERLGKLAVLVFSNAHVYSSYVALFSPEESVTPMSGGMCLPHTGYVHMAFSKGEWFDTETIFAHELTHAYLCHRNIPLWLDEALAMRMEEVLCGGEVFHLDQEIYERHQNHWSPVTIQEFWTGESWGIPGDSFDLSYNLAQILWRRIEGDLGADRDALIHFIEHAIDADAGDEALQLVFGISLEDLVSSFLGEGDWSPRKIDEGRELLA